MKNIFSVLLISILWIYMYLEWIVGRVIIPYDSLDEFYPFTYFISQSYRNGQAPWWNPYNFVGFPIISDPQALIFSPLVMLPMAMISNPTPHYFDIVILFHVLICALGVYFLLRFERFSVGSSLFGAVIALGGGCLPARLEHSALIVSTATLPWFALAFCAVVRRPTLLRSLGLGVATGWMGLHLVQTTFLAVYIATFFCVTLAIRRILFKGELSKLFMSLGFAALIAVMICGVQIASLFTFLEDTTRTKLPVMASAASSAPLRLILTFIDPNAMNTFSETYNGVLNRAESVSYYGIIGTLFVIVGVFSAIHKFVFVKISRYSSNGRNGICIFSLIVCVFAVVYSLGLNTPLYEILYGNLPGFSLFRRPVDAMFIVTISVAILGANGSEYVLGKFKPLYSNAGYRVLTICLLIIFSVWDLGRYTLTPNFTNGAPSDAKYLSGDLDHSANWLRNNLKQLGQPDWRVAFDQAGPYTPNMPAVSHFYSINGYNPLVNARYNEVFGTTLDPYAPQPFSKWNSDFDSPLFAMLSVKYVVTEIGSLADKRARNSHLTPAYTSDGKDYWENSNRVPRLFSPSAVLPTTVDQAAHATASISDPAETIVIEANKDIINECSSTKITDLKITKYRNTDVYLSAYVTARSGWVVLTDPATAGWHAYIDQHEVPIYRADGYMRAICVPSGQHNISFRFRPFMQILSHFTGISPYRYKRWSHPLGQLYGPDKL